MVKKFLSGEVHYLLTLLPFKFASLQHSSQYYRVKYRGEHLAAGGHYQLKAPVNAQPTATTVAATHNSANA